MLVSEGGIESDSFACQAHLHGGREGFREAGLGDADAIALGVHPLVSSSGVSGLSGATPVEALEGGRVLAGKSAMADGQMEAFFLLQFCSTRTEKP